MEGIKIAVLISGGGTNLQALIDAVEAGFIKGSIALVISDRKGAFGLIRAENHGIQTMLLDKNTYGTIEKRDAVLLQALQEKEIDLVVLAGYLAIVPQNIIAEYRNKIINIHPSLIPSFCGNGYYGEKVHQEAFNRGVKVTGATVHFVNEETDGGPIILQEIVAIDFDDDWKDIQLKVLKIEHKILPLAVKLFAEDRLEVIGNRVKIN
ncbi:phosphoribosylglycinamide formyltransferase [Clostridium formicaceticum]|uniref:Phosphoribosylglycinamide formyltransferase n=1 Tax=Clostridium formicaceticum TaxID=1497 RepID=A0AAC9RHU8_9CLOT|nr:phosphoribosylglycinamide formyltransferase [Clostridium formicaceticum]AOY75766.1 phosphoribosylglycinamide formyltransferase [Clostridium formicaceticum]ARE86092.1 Phosphoribosylglycinamide formyltransferase [Clostridium formicaceticum]